MYIDKRREDRFPTELPVSLVLRIREDGVLLCDPFSAFVVDLSGYGVRLVMEHVRFETFHLFYTPRDKTSCSLFLQAERPEAEPLDLPVWPVWFNRAWWGELKPFQMGVEFLLHPHDEQLGLLKKLLKEHRGGGGLKDNFSPCAMV